MPAFIYPEQLWPLQHKPGIVFPEVSLLNVNSQSIVKTFTSMDKLRTDRSTGGEQQKVGENRKKDQKEKHDSERVGVGCVSWTLLCDNVLQEVRWSLQSVGMIHYLLNLLGYVRGLSLHILGIVFFLATRRVVFSSLGLMCRTHGPPCARSLIASILAPRPARCLLGQFI